MPLWQQVLDYSDVFIIYDKPWYHTPQSTRAIWNIASACPGLPNRHLPATLKENKILRVGLLSFLLFGFVGIFPYFLLYWVSCPWDLVSRYETLCSLAVFYIYVIAREAYISIWWSNEEMSCSPQANLITVRFSSNCSHSCNPFLQPILDPVWEQH